MTSTQFPYILHLIHLIFTQHIAVLFFFVFLSKSNTDEMKQNEQKFPATLTLMTQKVHLKLNAAAAFIGNSLRTWPS